MPYKNKGTIDIHCHLARINPHFKNFDEIKLNKNIIAFYKIWTKLVKVTWSNDINTLNQRLDAKLYKLTQKSKIDYFVIMALDGVYDAQGEIINEKSVVYSQNQDVIDFCKKSSKYIPAFSINPMRKDAFAQLEQAAINNSAYIKWLPGLQKFDPVGTKSIEFAKKCAEINMPILIHLGQEFSFPGMKIEKKYHKINILTDLLKTNCKIIVPHAGGFSFLRENQSVKYLEKLVTKYPNLFFDNSGMLTYHRKARLLKIQKNSVLQDKILFGTDYPCTVHALPFATKINPKKMLRIFKTKNIFDKDFLIKKELNFEEKTFTNAHNVIYKQKNS